MERLEKMPSLGRHKNGGYMTSIYLGSDEGVISSKDLNLFSRQSSSDLLLNKMY